MFQLLRVLRDTLIFLRVSAEAQQKDGLWVNTSDPGRQAGPITCMKVIWN